MFQVIMNWLKAKAEELLAGEQPGFRPGWSTVELIFIGRVITGKQVQHQRDLFHNFTDFKKAFNRVRHAGLWQVLKSFSTVKGLVRAIQALRDLQQHSPLDHSARGVLGVLEGNRGFHQE